MKFNFLIFATFFFSFNLFAEDTYLVKKLTTIDNEIIFFAQCKDGGIVTWLDDGNDVATSGGGETIDEEIAIHNKDNNGKVELCSAKDNCQRIAKRECSNR
ncbi:hypothetical protein [Pseudoalteromonas piratica]|uniref:Uncharacterized protein n=1 Tax=Pseudoalteromonas piratica TaxID=1348114 RepID=A0A0A7EJJ2_9GAMM|nr:hypothetical protein [Pseudoalteromonas piratica]AIY66708.1 hypothetical protein OM33_16405 [Pseudoalteromonas piratica]